MKTQMNGPLKTAYIGFRAREDHKDLFCVIADRADMTLGDWLRKTLIAAARAEAQKQTTE